MAQQEIYNYLKRNKPRWFSSKEIAEDLEASLYAVTSCLKRLREGKTVNFKVAKKPVYRMGKRKVYVYRYKK